MELKPGYKMTEVGVIPEDWEIAPINKLFSIYVGGDLRKSDFCSQKTNENKYPIFSNSLSNSGLYGYSSTFDFDQEGITVTARGTIGHAFFHNKNFCAIGRLLVLQKKIPLSCIFFVNFINYFISFPKESTGVPQLTAPQLGKVYITYPKYPEQQAIAAALSDVDELLSSLDRLIAKKKDIRLATMQELLTGKKRLPGFNEAWKSIQINQLGYYKSGNVFPISCQLSSLYPNTIPFFKVSDLNNHIKYLINSKNSITIENAKNIHATIIPSKSIIFAKIGAAIFLERKRILKQNSYIDNNMCAFICKNNISYEFIYYKFINTSLSNLVSTTALPALGTKELNSISFFMPSSLAEQQAIASVLSDMDAEIEALEARRDKVRNIKRGMMQELLTGKTRLISAGEPA